ncbi:thiamine pyrophosphate-binding protein [Brucellaceae bacterium C25G]
MSDHMHQGGIVQRSGGQLLVDALSHQGVERIFCVPGESYLAVLDALHDKKDEIDLIVCRQEGGAAYMAEAYGKMTEKPGICFVTRGPGATNASIGVHTAFQDSTPMILFIGQVAGDQVEREAFQEIDYRRMFGQMAKWVVQIDDAARIPELVSQAFHRAVNGRPGPVVVALPEDMLTALAIAEDVPAAKQIEMHVAPSQLDEMLNLLNEAKRPILIAGGGGWNKKAVENLQQFAEKMQLPVAASFRCQDLFNNNHPLYAGDLGTAVSPQLADSMRQADLLLVVGARLGEMTTQGYALVQAPLPQQKLIHVHAGAEELGRVYYPALAINASMPAFCREAAKLHALSNPAWEQWAQKLRNDFLLHIQTPTIPGPVQMGEIMDWLKSHVKPDTIITNGAGNYSTWAHRFYQYSQFRTQLAPTSGSMGYGVPAAIAAKLQYPDRMVLGFAGDGCFLMNGQELATAAQYGANVIFIVINNGMYGTIRMHQERTYPARVSGTSLQNPDFAALARAYHCHAELVEKTEDFAPAFERCENSGKPSLIEIRIDPEALSPKMTLSQMRDQGFSKQK